MNTGYSLHRVETVLRMYEENNSEKGINDILEYYNILLCFDNNTHLSNWDEKQIGEYAPIVKKIRADVGRFFHKVDGKSLCFLYEQTEFRFKDSFFSALTKYKVAERVSNDEFTFFLDTYPHAITYVLQNKNLVHKYGQVITNQLILNVDLAETIINHYYVKHDRGFVRKTYMPSELEKGQQEIIIKKYVEWDNANINYLQLISGQKKAGDYPIDDRVRFKAHKRVQEYWGNYFKNEDKGMEIDTEVIICNQEAAVIEGVCKNENIIYKLSYSKQWIDENLDYPTLCNNFIYLFEYVDAHYRCTFLSNSADLGIMEREIGIHGNNEYPIGIRYKNMKMRSSLQMCAYRKELLDHGIEMESLFKWFFEEYLKIEFGVDNYKYFAPSSESSNLERILLIASQIDAVLKQYRLYVEDGEINRELFEFSSSVYKIVDACSMIERKYLYPGNADISKDLFLLFSDQCMLSYTEKTGETYNSFIELIINENIRVSDCPEYNHIDLKWLLDRAVIFEDNDGYLRIRRPVFNTLLDLYRNGCIAYSYCNETERAFVEELLKQGALEEDSSLFTRQEKEYLDYMLNTQRFVNGPEIRNKYVHGCFSFDPETHQSDYIELLKIMVLLVLKINEEFCLKFPLNKDAQETVNAS